jgi:hypothetical protein
VDVLAEAERLEILGLLRAVGDVEASRRVGVARGSLARAAAGLPLRRGTVALIRVWLGPTAVRP